MCVFFFFQAEDGIRDGRVTGVQTCALPILNFRSIDDFHPDSAVTIFRKGSTCCTTLSGWKSSMLLKFSSTPILLPSLRSEERRVGKECRARWWSEQRQRMKKKRA